MVSSTPLDTPLADDLVTSLRALAQGTAGLELLVVHGSRARGEASTASDWDFGFVGAVDLLSLTSAIGSLVESDRVDMADLDRAGALLRYRVARDGVLVFERHAGAFDTFWMDAVRFYCDAQPVLDAGWDGVLATLPR